MSKKKYKSAHLSLSTMSSTGNCKRTGLKLMPSAPVPKLFPYAKLIEYVNSINIGNVHAFVVTFATTDVTTKSMVLIETWRNS